MSQGEHQDLIIIKRVDEEEHEHHSSAWKVAHADFMTAMMAFFLIMWLINATDDEVRKMIAAYFNPVDLAASVTNQKGVLDPADAQLVAPPDGESGKGDGEGRAEEVPAPSDAEHSAREKAAFQDPYSVLAKLAEEVEPNQNSDVNAPEGEAGDPGQSGGDVLRDPFDPAYWQSEEAQMEPPVTIAGGTAGKTGPDQTHSDTAAERQAAAQAQVMGREQGAATTATAASVGGATSYTQQPLGRRPLELTGAAVILPPEEGVMSNDSEVTELARDLDIAMESSIDSGAKPHLLVQETSEGLLVSLTDDIDYSMFESGSAVPAPKVVVAMARIAEALAQRDGEIVVRGYTDARPFRSETYDNWRLSSARAHMARYMLIRGGLDEDRIVSVEGRADRELKNEADPNAAENRRIEILLREPDQGGGE
ncbi:MotB family protein [Amorphus orientalis]|uniref:Chemotaxis protein MotB n=1 Tax=Amorphus orientalis TaxID=649198 RepID=A0AAE3VTM0_9HYPH|nr:MotB family protein [Amorphus orientalis]MDQ0317605.1 chemotaxis protein MotB [Amorphus orientalis]